MATPKDILAVKRPKNTVVITYGKDRNLYAVRQRVGCRRVRGCNLPVTGPTIGHIRDGKYIALADETQEADALGSSVDLKDWADVALCSKCFSGNMLGVTAYEAFIRENGVKDGILVGDKGFPSSAIESCWSAISTFRPRLSIAPTRSGGRSNSSCGTTSRRASSTTCASTAPSR